MATLSHCINTMNLSADLPHFGSRTGAIIRERIHYIKDGKLDVQDLHGADMMDPGNYGGGIGSLRAAESRDQQTRKDVPEYLDTEFFPIEATESGAFRTKGLSATTHVVALMGCLMHHQDFASATLHAPDPGP